MLDSTQAVNAELLRQLLAERDIRAVLMRYCRGVDRCDVALIESCFHHDASDDHGNWQVRGATRIARHIAALVGATPDRAMHFMGNVSIEVVDHSAFAESYVLAFRTFERDGKEGVRTRAVRFVDRFELRDGAWRISERVVVDDWNRVDELLEKQAGWERFRYSCQGPADPVYAIRQGAVARNALAESPEPPASS